MNHVKVYLEDDLFADFRGYCDELQASQSSVAKELITAELSDRTLIKRRKQLRKKKGWKNEYLRENG